MFENLTVKTRFIILIGVVIIAQLCIIFIGEKGFNIAARSLDSAYIGGVEDIQMLSSIRDLFTDDIRVTIFQAREGVISTSQAQEIIKEARAKIKDIWTRYLQDLKEAAAKEGSDIINTNKTLLDQVESRMKEIAAKKNQDALKNDDREAVTKYGEEELILLPSLLKDLDQLMDLHSQETQNDYKNGNNALSELKFYTLLAMFGSAILVIVLAIWTALDITRPLKKAVEVIKKLTLGDLSFQINHRSKSEMGQLLEAMNDLGIADRKMSDALTSVSRGDLAIKMEARSEADSLGLALIDMIHNLKHIIGEIQQGVATLNANSQEIVSSVSQVATSSAETAATVTETMISVEELKQTAHVADEKAKEVLSSSEETLQVVTISEQLLEATMKDMSQISEKMGVISEGILKLSEHGQTIGDIIGTVNELAEQSNLLAVNAAIEAAKAGEHGKSFAVVAQEIRTLAEQSKAATIQVRSILNEIQRSTTAVVLATEQGTKAVEKGVQQSTQTNESMQKLSQSITHVTQAANQIAISSQQQFVGVNQVTDAMSNINEASTLLVDHMKQIETAVNSLKVIGEDLKALISQYTLAHEEQEWRVKSKQMRPLSNFAGYPKEKVKLDSQHLSQWISND